MTMFKIHPLVSAILLVLASRAFSQTATLCATSYTCLSHDMTLVNPPDLSMAAMSCQGMGYDFLAYNNVEGYCSMAAQCAVTIPTPGWDIYAMNGVPCISTGPAPSAAPIPTPTTAPIAMPTASPTASPTLIPTSSPTHSVTLCAANSYCYLPGTSFPATDATSCADDCQGQSAANTYFTFGPGNCLCSTATQCAALASAPPGNDVYAIDGARCPGSPSALPTLSPTTAPTTQPSADPTTQPSAHPTTMPTANPTAAPTLSPTTSPSAAPTNFPTQSPTLIPTTSPSAVPTISPTAKPSHAPTPSPTSAPSEAPTVRPTTQPSAEPTVVPTLAPTFVPTCHPTASPSAVPTIRPTLSTQKSFKLSLAIQQAVYFMSKDDYSTNQAAFNLTIQHTVAAALDGVTPDQVTDIQVSGAGNAAAATVGRAKGAAGRIRGAQQQPAASDPSCTLAYQVSVFDPRITMDSLQEQLQTGVANGAMDASLHSFATAYGIHTVGNASFAAPTVSYADDIVHISHQLTGVGIAGVVIGAVLFLLAAATIVYFIIFVVRNKQTNESH